MTNFRKIFLNKDLKNLLEIIVSSGVRILKQMVFCETILSFWSQPFKLQSSSSMSLQHFNAHFCFKSGATALLLVNWQHDHVWKQPLPPAASVTKRSGDRHAEGQIKGLMNVASLQAIPDISSRNSLGEEAFFSTCGSLNTRIAHDFFYILIFKFAQCMQSQYLL